MLVRHKRTGRAGRVLRILKASLEIQWLPTQAPPVRVPKGELEPIFRVEDDGDELWSISPDGERAFLGRWEGSRFIRAV